MSKKTPKYLENGLKELASEEHPGKIIKELKFKPKTIGQNEYVSSMIKNDITFCSGYAGTGKSLCAIAVALKALQDGRVERICITRPCVETSRRGTGFLPGNLDEKMAPFVRPLEDIFIKLIGEDIYKQLKQKKAITIEPLEFMRGTTFDDSFVILSEAQNTTFDQLYMFVTRLGENCRMVIEGDERQNDLFIFQKDYDPSNPNRYTTGFETMIDYVHGLDFVGVCEMTEDDIVRSKKVKALMIHLNRKMKR